MIGQRVHARAVSSSKGISFWEMFLVTLLTGVTLLLLSPLNIPFMGRDEGVFVYIGQQIAQGKVPYRDVWDHKGPLIYYINALGIWIGNGSPWGVWLIEGLLIATSLLLLYVLLRRSLTQAPAMFGLLTWLAGFTIVMGGNIVEEYSVILVVLSLLLVMYKPHAASLLAGILTGLAFMLRPNESAAPALAFLFISIEQMQSIGRRSLLSNTLQYMLGFLVIGVGTVAYFALNHALGDFLSSVFLFNYLYVTSGGNFAPAFLSGIGYLSLPVLFAVGGLASAWFLRKQALSDEQKRLLYFALALLCLTVPLSLLSGRVYRHYYVPWLLPLSILAAYFCFFIMRSTSRQALRKSVWVVAWFVLTAATIIGVRIRATPLLAHGIPSREMQTTADIQATVHPDQMLLIWGNETTYAVMSDRKLASRYIYLGPLLTPGYGESVAAQLLVDIRNRHPVIIDTSPGDHDIPTLDGEPPYPYLMELYGFIHAHYIVSGTVGPDHWVVWQSE